MGISNKKTTSNTTQTANTNSSTTPIVPSWVDSLVQGVGGSVGALSGVDPASYVAPVNSTLNTANTNALGLTGTPWAYDGSTDLATGVAHAKAPSIAGHLSEFMNPWLKDVVGATSADLSASEDKTRSQQALDLTRSGAFGGSGAALTQSATEGELARARVSTIGALNAQGYNTALGGATSQAGLDQNQLQQRLQAAGLISQNANDFGANQRANVESQGAIGSILQQIQQLQAGAPVALAGAQTQMLGSLPLQMFNGSNTTGTVNSTGTSTGKESGATLTDWLNYFASNAKAAAAAGGG